MKESKSFRLIDEDLPLLVRKAAPSLAEVLRNLSIVGVRIELDDLSSFFLRPDHEGVHWPFDVVFLVLLGLSSIRVGSF